MAQLFPSLLAADQTNLKEIIKTLNPYVPGFHIDIMDNHFVPNLSFGSAMINTIAQLTDKILWVHLMINHPELFIKKLCPTGPMTISFHIEAQGNHEKTIGSIKNIGARAGIALSPQTPDKAAFPYLNQIDQVLIMSVEPGFAGQPLIPDTLHKIDSFIGYRQTSKKEFSIGVDGGITAKNLQEVTQKGADWIAIGSTLFSQKNISNAYQELEQSLHKHSN